MRACLIALVGALALNAHAELQTLPLATRPVPVQRLFDGQVEAVHAATVSGQTSGRVADIAFDVGDSVPAGATIIRLVSEDQQGGLQQAQAALADAQAGLKVDQQELTRIEELFAKGVVSKAELERAEGRVKSREAQVKNAEGALRRAQQQLAYTIVQAPFGGVVSERHIELGEAVAPGTPLMSGFDPDILRVVVNIPQDIADKVRESAAVQVVHQRATLTPEKVLVYPVANPVSGSVKARLNLPKGNHGLRPGQWVKVAIQLGEENQLLIPRSAVLQRSQVSAVYVQQEGALQLRNVRLGKQRGDDVVVSAGLNPGDVLVLNPLDALLQKAAAEGAAHE
jgi:membrane fusion protein, multidrug efflux system